MREVVLDTETTGLDPEEGHRIVEIGAVELVNALPTGRVYHQYINPERSMPPDAFQVHGLGDAFLSGQPVFAAIADAFSEFLGSAPLVIHNAAFDMAMINAEFARLGRPALPRERAVDTLAIARRKFPGAQLSLDALCRRFGIDNGARTKHGALLDSELLAEVYLELQGGRQHGLGFGEARAATAVDGPAGSDAPARPRALPLPPRITEAERDAHARFLEEMGPDALWHGARRPAPETG